MIERAIVGAQVLVRSLMFSESAPLAVSTRHGFCVCIVCKKLVAAKRSCNEEGAASNVFSLHFAVSSIIVSSYCEHYDILITKICLSASIKTWTRTKKLHGHD